MQSRFYRGALDESSVGHATFCRYDRQVVPFPDETSSCLIRNEAGGALCIYVDQGVPCVNRVIHILDLVKPTDEKCVG